MKYKIVEYFSCENQTHWLNRIELSKWSGSKALFYLLSKGEMKKVFGESTELFLLTDNEELLGYCTLSPQDNIQPTSLTPWMGFLNIEPEYRGNRYSEILMNYTENKARDAGFKNLYVSTEAEGFFEKFGYDFVKIMVDVENYDLRVYHKSLN